MRRYALILALVCIPASLGGTDAFAADATASIPALSGTWERNGLTHYEQPASGPGPIVNLSRRADGTMPGDSVVGDYRSPILKPAAAAVVKRRGELSASGVVPPDPHNQCQPEPPPFSWTVQFAVQVLQEKDKVTLVYLAGHYVRHIRLNAQHPDHPKRTWEGDSVGRYEGDTLVVDTVGLRVGPLAMVDRYGTPFGEALHMVERFRLIDGEAAAAAQRKHALSYRTDGVPNAFNGYGDLRADPDRQKKGLQVEVSIDDPQMFTSKWSGLVTFRPTIGEWPEAVCNEAPSPTFQMAIPVADRPDF